MIAARPLRRVLRALLPGSEPRRRALVVQHLGFECSDLDTLPAVLDEVGRELGVDLRLDGIRGDVVLAKQAFVSRVAPQVLNAFLEDRPLLTITDVPATALNGEVGGAEEGGLPQARRKAQRPHAELVRQLQSVQGLEGLHETRRATAEAPSTVPVSGFDSQFDTGQHADQLSQADLDPDRAQLLNLLRRGLVDPSQPSLSAGYGRQATLLIDFATGVALVDELADQRLRVTRDVPYLARGATPGPLAKARELDLVVWDIALAAGGFRLLNSPVNWWHTPLLAQPQLNVSRYTLLPQHLELARHLGQGPVSPADLRRRCRVNVTELRGFLQAGLFLGLLHWVPSASVQNHRA
ncbi:MAG: hypothetical protein LCI02_05785 [Proteobacteria bacterium]|nr:hypothetical protein [Pseudomonadota bacterium]